MVVEEDDLEQFNENWNDDSLINDNVFYASNVDVGIDDHFIYPLDIYDPRNWGILDAKTINILIENGLLENWIGYFWKKMVCLL